jgi:ORF6N domain
MSNPHGLVERITKTILFIRGEKVLLDADLAALYGVATGTLVRAVKRNIERFPDDFMLQLTEDEWVNLRSQIGISSSWGGRRYAPYAFTEQGVAMLSGVLRSEQAVLVNIEIMRAFVRLREILSTHHELAKKLNNLERKYDSQFKAVFDAIRQLMEPPVPKKKPIGFHKGE